MSARVYLSVGETKMLWKMRNGEKENAENFAP